MATVLETNGKCAVVTGAASGIGKSIAIQLADEGMDLAIADINADGLRDVAKDLEARGVKVITSTADMASWEAVDAFAQEVFDWAEGRLMMVFANAGIHGQSNAIDPDLALFEKVISVNLMGPVHMTKAFMPRLIEQNTPAQLAITGSQASFLGAPGIAPYVTTKHGLWGYADSVRIELAMAGNDTVGISLIAPSRVDTGMTRPQIEDYRKRGGDKAAKDYETSMVGSGPIAEVVIREAKKRAFWIIPSHEPTMEAFKSRANAIIEAMPAGAIKVG